jgi:ABC-type sugar transport system ATPase subunit
VTHDQVEAMTMADRIVVLRSGRVEQVGTPLALYNAPDNRFVAGFIGSPQMNFLKGSAVNNSDGSSALTLEASDGSPIPLMLDPAAQGRSVVVGVRPEHIVPAASSTTAARLDTTVERVEQLGAMTFSYCALPNGERLTVQSAGQTAVSPGERMPVAIPYEHLHVFDAESGRSLLKRSPS